MNKDIAEEIEEKAIDNKLSGSVAGEIAQDIVFTYKESGEASDALSIKRVHGEFGCF